MKEVLIFGATGYLGGALLVRLRGSHPDWRFVAVSRNEKHDTALTAAGVAEVVRASHEDLKIVRERAKRADIVINCADADGLELTRAILDGLAARKREGRATGVLLHTSGTGVVCDDGGGSWSESARIWSDASEQDIRDIPASNPHRNVDLAIFEADASKQVNAYIIAPATIYGIGDGPVKRMSAPWVHIVGGLLKTRKVTIVGEGTNRWNNVHISDIVELYELVLERALSGADEQATAYGKFYFGSVGTYTMRDCTGAIGEILYAKGLVDSREAVSVDLSALPALPIYRLVGVNTLTKSDRGFALGWKPRGPTMEEGLEEEMVVVLGA